MLIKYIAVTSENQLEFEVFLFRFYFVSAIIPEGLHM